jgi:hypothetical protein
MQDPDTIWLMEAEGRCSGWKNKQHISNKKYIYVCVCVCLIISSQNYTIAHY